MADRDKVFDALRNCITEPKCKDCPWDCERVGHKKTEVPVTLLLDTLELLREQEPVKPDCGHAEHDGIGCLGYAASWHDDEPIDACKTCREYTGNRYWEVSGDA